MNNETKRLAIVATICFFPAAIAGWLFYPKSEQTALRFFRLSIYIFVIAVMLAGLVVVTKGGALIKPMGSFF